MRQSHENSIGVDSAFAAPKFERVRPPKNIHAFERLKNSLIAQEDVVAVESQSIAFDGIRALQRQMSSLRAGICPEPVAKVTVMQLKRLRLIAVVKVVNAFERMWLVACDTAPERDTYEEQERWEQMT
jgi:hypothetical protein